MIPLNDARTKVAMILLHLAAVPLGIAVGVWLFNAAT